MLKLPTLYKRTSTGKIEQWSIRVEEPKDQTVQDGDDLTFNIVTEHGLLGGKLQESVESVYEGKNLGKANATSSRQQAESQARSEWNAKLSRKGYTEDLTKAEAGGNDGAGGVRPMLAHKFTDHGEKVVFPCYAQPKLDGIRCLAVVNTDGSVGLWSREQKPIVSLPLIANRVAGLGLKPGAVLDGEIYNHSLKQDFERIVSMVRRQDQLPAEDAYLAQYHVYDVARDPHLSPEPTFGTRTIRLHLLLDNRSWKKGLLQLVETRFLHDLDELQEYFKSCRDRGYEGCMVRGSDSPYTEGKRSQQLLKMKEMEDDDFVIVGVREGVGKMAGLAVFTCVTADGQVFDVKLEGPLEGLRKYVVDESTWVDKKLTVQYQGLTKKGVPRFPVGKTVRDYE